MKESITKKDKTITNLENSIKSIKNNIKQIELNSTFNYISELEKLKDKSDLQYNKQQKESQIKNQQLNDLAKSLNKKLDSLSPTL